MSKTRNKRNQRTGSHSSRSLENGRSSRLARASGLDFVWNRRKGIIVFLSAIPIALLFESVGLFKSLETKALDVQMFLQRPPSESDVAIVRITDEDYKNTFHGKSPLDPSKLQEIIELIAAGKPKLIGVDIDTSAAEFRNFRPNIGALPMVWARESIYSHRSESYHLLDVLGGQTLPAGSSAGLITFKLDSDDVIRRYTRLCNTEEGPFPSFPWAVLKEVSGHSDLATKEHTDDLLIDFRGGSKLSYRFKLKSSDLEERSKGEAWSINGPLTNKIVLLGGDYKVQDEHQTPVGWMLGVEVLAQIIETELRGGGVKPPGSVLMMLLGLCDALVLYFMFHKLRTRYALLSSVLAIPSLSLLCSYLAFRSLERWAYFASILLIILIYQLYERAKERFKQARPSVNPAATEEAPATSEVAGGRAD